MKAKTVFVGLSGGVDSSVTAALLLEQGYNVVGVFIKVWHPDFMICNWEEERLDAMRVAAHLGIPFLTCDAQEAYKRAVADYFVSGYQKGLTPNPDVLCNKEVKFGVFLDFALKNGADYIATGHYAQIEKKNNKIILKRGVDSEKDQSYFLWTLTSEQLKKVLFPIGGLPKSEVRGLAKKYELPTANKKDSQGICFLGHVDIPDFLSHYIDLNEGDVVLRDGTVVGVHKGALVYTIGQRHGFTITNKEYSSQIFYVCAKDVETNILTVDINVPVASQGSRMVLSGYTLRRKINIGDIIEAQFRYRQKPFPIKVEEVNSLFLTVASTTVIEAQASGQSCVLYEGDECIGGGTIV